MSDTVTLEPLAGIGHNNPPELTPYEAHKANIDDLFETAQGFLDGEPIADEKQANAVSKLLADARTARAAADEQRKLEAKPFDEGKAKVQALWTPLTDEKKGRCALIISTCKKVLAPYLEQKEAERLAAAEAARKEAERKVEEARAARFLADETDLTAVEQAEAATKEAERAQKAANRIENSRAQVKGGDRAVSLRTVWDVEFAKREGAKKEALAHYAAERREELLAWLLEQARADVNAGKRTIPGFKITDRKVAV